MPDVMIIINNGNPVKTKDVLTVNSGGGKVYDHNDNYIVNSGIVNDFFNRLDTKFDDSDFKTTT